VASVPLVAPAVPSWRRVLATTIGLWVARRLPLAGAGRRPASGRPRPGGPGPGRRGGAGFRWPARLRHRPSARSLRLPILAVALAAAAVAAAAVAVLRFTGTSSPVARSPAPGGMHPARAGYGAVGPGAPAGTAALVRSQAAAWIADQVGGNETIACDPPMCAALHGRGIAASRLLPLPSSAPADVIVTSSSVRRQPGGQLGDDTSALLASFGSGDSRIDIRAATPAGAAAYNSALQADLTARQAAGAQLLRSRRIEVGAQAAGQLEAGDVDTRVLVTLVTLASMHPLRVISFGDASPGERVPLADVPFRQVIIAGSGSPGAQTGLAAALAMVRAQRAPYQPDQASLLGLAGGQAELSVEFAAPGPLGLLAGGTHG
jgi:hypothetical protein